MPVYPFTKVFRVTIPLTLLWTGLVVSICGCGTSVRDAPSKSLKGSWYTVKQGDTLDSIRRRHGVNARDVRELNGLGDKQALKEGQRLFLFDSQPSVRRVHRGKSKKTKRARPRLSKQLPPQNRKWAWPIRGATLTSKFGRRGNRPHKGIDLAAKMGTPIYATADGVVIYSGSRQRGYGNLVILKHSDGYVSVYAHNRRNLVDEGQKVRQGFQIAELGNSGRSTGPHLHFEIRHKGKPLDPLRLIGRRP